MRKPLGVLAVAAALLSGCGGSGKVSGHGAAATSGAVVADGSRVAIPSGAPNPSDVAAADRAARATFAQISPGAPALYVGIWDPKRGTFVRAYGHAVRGGRAASVDDSLRIASITKTFTATVVLQLVAENKLALNGTVADYRSDLATKYPPLASITIDQLLAMRSGLPDYVNDPHGIASAIAADPHRVWTEEELLAAAMRLDIAAPGSAGYSNANYLLLGMIVEGVTGMPLTDLFKQRLVQPAGLTHTALPSPSDTSLAEPSAHGYLNQACLDKAGSAGAPEIDPDTDTTEWNTSYFQGAGGIVSTIGDLGAWGATNLGTSLLPTSIARERLDAHDIGGDGNPYGLGIKRFGAWYGHDGDAFGWDSLAVHNPTTGVTFVAAANACTGLNDAFLDLLQSLYPDQPTH